MSVWRYVTSDPIALWVDSIDLAGTCARDRDIDGDELSIAQNKAVLVTILVVVETDDFSLRVYAGNPRERGVGNVDRGEVSCLPQETMEYPVTSDVGANNSRGVDDHCWKRSRCPGNIDHSELASTEKVAVPVKKITADEFHAYDITGVADAEAGSTHRVGAGKIDRRKGAALQHVSVTAARVTIASHDFPTSVDPRNVGGERGAGHVNGCEHAVAENKTVLLPISAVIPPYNLTRRCNSRGLRVRRAWKIKRFKTGSMSRRKAGRLLACVVLSAIPARGRCR